MGHEPRDVLVVIERETTDTEGSERVRLHDGEGAFMDAELLTMEMPGGPAISEVDAHASSPLALAVQSQDRSREAALAAERDKLAADVERYRTELESSCAELERTKNEAEVVKERLKGLENEL